jgi:chemotaxis protein CheX
MAENEDLTTVALPSVLDLKAVGPLHQALLSARGTPLDIIASDVTRLGGLGLQLLLSARATWANDGLPFSVSAPSEDFNAALALFGAQDLTAADVKELHS